MRNAVRKFYEFIQQPLIPSSRIVIALLVVPLLVGMMLPLWKISLTAPQYPNGLYLLVYPYKLTGGNDGQHVQEINTLNHYIGMHPIDRAALNDLDWIPFALGVLAVLALRVAAIGNVCALLDLVVITGYVSLFSLARFAYKLYTFGHELDPRAPLKVEPFMPPLLGTKQIANFSSTSMPQEGTLLIGVFAAGIAAVALWHLLAGRRAAEAAERASGGPAPASLGGV